MVHQWTKLEQFQSGKSERVEFKKTGCVLILFNSKHLELLNVQQIVDKLMTFIMFSINR